MFQRILLGIIAVVALVLLIVYSQIRVNQPFVSGILETDEIRLGSRVGGRVKFVRVDEGDRVATGAPLIEFEPYELLEREQQAAAELAVRTAELSRLRKGLRPEEIAQAEARLQRLQAQLKLLELGPRPEEIGAAAERLISAQAQLQLAQREYDRQSNLAQANAVARGELDAAKEKFDAASANVEVKKNELEILKQGSRPQEIAAAQAQVTDTRLAWELAKQGFREEDIAAAEAGRDAAAASLAAIKQQSSELVITAPTDGYIDALDLRPGDLVGPNAPVMTLLSEQRMWVRSYVPQQFLRLKIGQRLQVTIDSFPDEKFTGTVSFLSHAAEFTPSNVQTVEDRAKQVYRMRVELENQNQRLRAGMTANVWLPMAE